MYTGIGKEVRIIVVDDTPANLKLLDKILKQAGYRVFGFPRAEMALKAARQNPPHLILMDVNMPGMDGYQACEVLKNDLALCNIPVIFISALNETMDKVRAFKIGGVDYINKPFQIEEVLARVDAHLKIRQLQMEMEIYNQTLKERVEEQVKEIADSQLATIFALAKLAESRDDETGSHLERVQAMVEVVSRRTQGIEKYKSRLSDDYIRQMCLACSLHDIGKVGIPDNILLKPGRLTLEEFEVMKTHTVIGRDTLKSVHENYPGNKLIELAIDIAGSHHERWDGSGYPDGLYGDFIPLSARIMSIVDVYDALRSQRPYKEPFSHFKSLAIIKDNAGSQFDPLLVEVFTDAEEDCSRIFNQHSSML